MIRRSFLEPTAGILLCGVIAVAAYGVCSGLQGRDDQKTQDLQIEREAALDDYAKAEAPVVRDTVVVTRVVTRWRELSAQAAQVPTLSAPQVKDLIAAGDSTAAAAEKLARDCALLLEAGKSVARADGKLIRQLSKRRWLDVGFQVGVGGCFSPDGLIRPCLYAGLGFSR